jgi:FkbM family methyltransferase
MSNRSLQINRLKHAFFTVTGLRKFLIADCEPYGLKFKFQLADGMGRDIYYKHGVYSEDYITRFLLDTLKLTNEDLVLDIGANIGWYSLVLSTRATPRVVAFEPDTLNYKLLTENLSMNGKINVKAYNKAVSDHDGILTLHLYKGYNPGRHSFIKQKNSIGTAEVPIIALDTFLETEGYGKGPIKFLKIDIEGYELTALHKAYKTLSRVEYILTEFSPDLMKAAGQEPEAYIKVLEDAGFKLQIIDEKGLHEPDFSSIIQQLKQVNIFGTKQ